MKLPIILLLILIIPLASALCEDGQIDINSASLTELQIFNGIGPSKAQAIIDYRVIQLFDSVDDLIDVSGIGPVTLGNIKSQGFACVQGEKQDETFEEEPEIEEIPEEEIVEEVIEKVFVEVPTVEEKIEDPVDLEVAELNAKVIKTDDSEESYNLYAILGLFTFSVLLTLLFLLKKQGENKNEFD